jgi:hypothetical protein
MDQQVGDHFVLPRRDRHFAGLKNHEWAKDHFLGTPTFFQSQDLIIIESHNSAYAIASTTPLQKRFS